MPLITLKTLPPGGWLFEQKDNNGILVKKFSDMCPFPDFCQPILECRVKNKFKRATMAEVMHDVEEAQCHRLNYSDKYCVVKKKPFQFNPAKLFKAVASHVHIAAERISNVADGSLILKDWLGDGAVPVPPEQAQNRADVCIRGVEGHACPHNKDGFEPIEEAAEFIRRQVEQKNQLQLSVEGEEQLKTCQICWCHLPLKVHVPMEHILAQTTEKMAAKFQEQAPPNCFMLTENQTPA